MSVSSQANQQPEQYPAIIAIAQKIEQLTEAQFTGSLNCDAVHRVQLRLFFVAGRLVWAGGGMHRLRRWRRLLKQICPEAIFALAQLTPEWSTPLWEYEALRGLLTEEHISRDQARTLITLQISEVLFDIVQSWSLTEDYEATIEDEFKIKDAITLIPAQDLLPAVQSQWHSWNTAGMQLYSPNLSPLLDDPERLKTQVTAATFAKLKQMLRGQHSLRELASLMGQDVAKFAHALVSYEQQRMLLMRITPDTSGSIPVPAGRPPELADLDAPTPLETAAQKSSRKTQRKARKSGSRSDKPVQASAEVREAPDVAIAALSPEPPNGEVPPQTAFSDTAIKRKQNSDLVNRLLANKSATKASPKSMAGIPAQPVVSPTNLPNQPATFSETNSPLIICVDDHQQVRDKMGEVLTEQGYRYRGIANASEALQVMIDLQPALIFVDLVMPDISGYELCSQIRRINRLQGIPIVILTGNDTVFDRMLGKLAGATEYLTKPTTPEEILDTVAQQLTLKAS